MFQASEFGARRASNESNEPCEKKTKVRQITLEDVCNPLKTQDKSEFAVDKPSKNKLLICFFSFPFFFFPEKEPQKCEKPRICLQTLGRLREFCSDSDQQNNRFQENSFQKKESLSLEKCPSIIGRSSELKNRLQSWDSSPQVAQKVRRALVKCCADYCLWFKKASFDTRFPLHFGVLS
uniref:Uncharacterized protein n=1 Tax=Amazona collaria TaxID=241587 RepID=A0A8B9IW30_9PSIT